MNINWSTSEEREVPTGLTLWTELNAKVDTALTSEAVFAVQMLAVMTDSKHLEVFREMEPRNDSSLVIG